MNREALDKFFERGILSLVLAILIFAPLAMGAVEAWSFLVVQALAIVVLVLWSLRLWLGAKPQLLWPPICWPALAFVLYAVARYLTADIEYVARQELIQVLVIAILFFAVINNLYRQEFSQAVSFTMIFLAAGISGFAFFQYLTHSQRVWNEISPYGGRASGTYISPNDFAGFLEMLLPLAVAYVLAGRMKMVMRILTGYAALLIAAGLVLSFSRGGWAASAIGLAALFVALLGRRNTRIPAALALAALLVGGGIFANYSLSKSLTYREHIENTLQTDGKVNWILRSDMWRAATEMWRDHFWLGVGPAHYNYVFREYRPPNVQLQPDRAHNDYLNLLADWGAIGGIIVLAGMAAFAAGLAKTSRHVQRAENSLGSSSLSNRHAFFLGAAAALLALAAHSFVDFNLHIPANAILGATLLALLSSNLRFATEKFWVNLRTTLKVIVTVALAAGIFYLGRQGIRRAGETCWTARAQNPDLLMLDRAAILEKAFAAEPKNFQTAYDIGELHRLQSFDGGSDYQSQAETALHWFAVAMKLNPHDGYGFLRTGMCLDWLGRTNESDKFYSAAETRDPNGYFTAANIGWHYVQIGDYAAAHEWLVRSLQLKWAPDNPIAASYLDIVEQKLKQKASQKSPLPAGF